MRFELRVRFNSTKYFPGQFGGVPPVDDPTQYYKPASGPAYATATNIDQLNQIGAQPR